MANLPPPPLMALTLGDPAGVGPEIVLKAAADPETFRLCRPLAVGPAAVAAEQARALGIAVEVQPVASPGAATFRPGHLCVLDTGGVAPGDVRWGELSAAAGRAGVTAVERAAQLAMAGEVDAIVTAPLNKEAIRMAGVSYPGHTEILGAVTNSPSVAMLLVSDTLRVIHVSVHCSLREAIERVTEANEYRAIRTAHEGLRRFGFERPRIAVAGLNPHAGEGGLFGDEEIRAIQPAIARASAEGLDVTGPWPADTIFWRASRGEFDVVVAQYHDEGHVAIKMHGFEGGVNVTLGLPIIRTSVDHGTAFDIAGRGVARHQSLLAAIRVAAQLVQGQR
jgi:4-phospho-D-threonate 3-dehydrogenase / 4-phospho-D-erythronate 3-dehydrogenase